MTYHQPFCATRCIPLHLETAGWSKAERFHLYVHRENFLRCLYEAVDSGDMTAAAKLFYQKIEPWIEDLRLYTMKAPGLNCAKAAELMVKQRSRNLTYIAALKIFGSNPKMETLVALREALKEL